MYGEMSIYFIALISVGVVSGLAQKFVSEYMCEKCIYRKHQLHFTSLRIVFVT